MKAIKGFDAQLKCRNFQFEVGQTYKHEGAVKACRSGFHAVPADLHPLTVFEFYPPAGSRFCIVEVDGQTDREENKIAAEILTVQKEIGLHDLATEAVKWVMDRATLEGPVATKDNGLATASGDQGAATASGTRGAATASGYQGAATASGEMSCAMATGPGGKVRGDVDGVDLFAREIVWTGDKYERRSIACGTTGLDGIRAGVWYRCEGGKLVEVAQ
jgi:hypothetical protein